MSSTESCSWYRIQKLGDMQPLDHRSQEGGPLDIRYEDDNAAADDDDNDNDNGDNNDNGKGVKMKMGLITMMLMMMRGQT